MRLVALIPARAGSKRCPGKNLRELNGRPLLAWAVAAAREAGIFSTIAVSSEDATTLDIARQCGAVPIRRPESLAFDWSPDIDWVLHADTALKQPHDAFAILRPTSPFRRGDWIRIGWGRLLATGADSLRAMRPVTEHPGKMWRAAPNGSVAYPLMPLESSRAPWHSMPSQELPRMLVQTAALEIAWRDVLDKCPATIAGEVVCPYVCETDAPEAVDVNTERDWDRAQFLARLHPEWLPDG